MDPLQSTSGNPRESNIVVRNRSRDLPRKSNKVALENNKDLQESNRDPWESKKRTLESTAGHTTKITNMDGYAEISKNVSPWIIIKKAIHSRVSVQPSWPCY